MFIHVRTSKLFQWIKVDSSIIGWTADIKISGRNQFYAEKCKMGKKIEVS